MFGTRLRKSCPTGKEFSCQVPSRKTRLAMLIGKARPLGPPRRHLRRYPVPLPFPFLSRNVVCCETVFLPFPYGRSSARSLAETAPASSSLRPGRSDWVGTSTMDCGNRKGTGISAGARGEGFLPRPACCKYGAGMGLPTSSGFPLTPAGGTGTCARAGTLLEQSSELGVQGLHVLPAE